jgi:hypothetical protein
MIIPRGPSVRPPRRRQGAEPPLSSQATWEAWKADTDTDHSRSQEQIIDLIDRSVGHNGQHGAQRRESTWWRPRMRT